MKSKTFNFKIIKKDAKTRARAGVITTPHGVIETPCFVPVGTKATVKGLTPQDLKEIGAQLLFGNTYHLHLQPGEEIVNKFGGLGKFMSWDGPASPSGGLGGPTITDSGGFQVFSLGKSSKSASVNLSVGGSSSLASELILHKSQDSNIHSSRSSKSPPSTAPRELEETPLLLKITDDGAMFRSHIDGSLHEFTPEKSIEIQHKLGADIILAFDWCAPYPFTYENTKEAMEKTHKWAVRCLKYHKAKGKRQNSKVQVKSQKLEQTLYGIVQGGVYKDLREESAKFIGSLPFDGIAIGGVSVGESKKEMREAVNWIVPYLPEEKPRHLLGIGEIDDLFDGVASGMDTFDCVIPTRFGRYGIAFVGKEESEEKNRFRINLPKAKYAKDPKPIAKNCKCSTCQNFTRGYINHLFRCDELLGYRLVSYHNLYFIVNLVKEIRQAILEDRFEKMRKEWINVVN